MYDVANLAIKVDAEDPKKAAVELDKLGASSKKASSEVDKLGDQAEKTGKQTKGASEEAKGLANSYGKLTGAIAALGLGKIATDIARTNAEFQKLNAMLKVATGSAAEAAKAMNSIKEFAKETPFTLQQSVESFVRLQNLGLSPTIEMMRSFGNTASSMGKDMMQFVEAVADAVTGEFERLKEFGIKASKEGEKVTFTFQGASTTVGNSAEEIKKYLESLGNVQFAGAMAEQMQTLGGQFSNLQDSISAFYVAIGDAGANSALSKLLSSAADAVSYLTKNLDLFVDVLGAVVIGLVSYKAALIAGSLAQTAMTGSLGIYIGAVTTATTQVGLLAGAQVAMTGAAAGASTALRGLTLAMATNPVTALAVAVAALASGIYLLNQRTDAATEAQRREFVASAELKSIIDRSAEAHTRLATATGEARKEALAYTQQLKAEAEAHLQVARAALASAQARSLAASKAADEAREVARLNALSQTGSPIDDLAAIQNSQRAESALRKAEDAAWKASAAWRASFQEVSKLENAIKNATKPVAVLSSETGKATEAAKTHKSSVEEESAALKGLRDMLQEIPALLGDVSKATEEILDKRRAKELTDVLEAANDNYSEAAKAAMEAAAAQAHWNDELRQTIDALDGIGRAGQSIGDIGAILYGLQTGDFSGARGPAGYLLQQLSGIQWRTDDGEIKRFGDEVLGALDKVFGGNGTFAQTMNGLLQGAGTGAAIGQLAFNNKSGRTGATIGGALGSTLGPIGSIVGSLLGGLAGDLIRGNEKGRATFSGTGFSVSGDNNSREAAAADLARTVIEAAERVADALGATSVALSGTIGVRNSSIRFNPNGTSLKDGLNFGQDAEAAIKAAIANATFEGLSETFEKLLGSGSDIEDQIDKVLALSAALNEASERADPIGAQIEALNTQFDALRSYLDEGNATAEERAKIEELYSAKLAEINGQTSDAADLADKRREIEIALLTAQGDILGAVAMQREAELAALDESLRPLQEQVYAAQDLAVTRALEIQLMQAMGDEAGAVAAQRQIELSSLTDSQKAIQERIYALNDAREAEQAAAQEAARIAQERVGLETRLLTLQGDVAALRQRELDALDPSNRAIQEQIYALEDLATANAEAARIADEAAAQARAIATEREGLEARLLQLQGDTIALRQREIESVDESNRALLEQIHFEEDRAEALAKIAAYRQREASEAESLQNRLLQLQGDTAALRQQELNALIPSNRALLEQIFALEDAADAAAQASEAERTLAAERDAIANERASLERRILELEGDTAALLALERAAISEGNRVLFDRIQQLEMEADRAEQLRLQTERLASSRAAIEDERYALETRLLQAVGATANLRDRELKLLDPANRKYLEFIYALEDQAAATAEAERAAAELAATEERIANERASLESRLLSLQGDTTALRALELASVDEANRAILELIYSLEDAQAEARAAAEAEEILAAERRAIESERYSLESRLLSLMGDTNAVRARELETVNEVNRSILQQIYALEDQQAAAAAAERAAADAARAQAEADRAAQQALREYESRVNEARNNLSSVYEREARAITEVQDRFEGFAENLRAFRDSLTNRTATGGDYRSAQVEFIKQSALAASGDEGGLAALAGAGNAFLQASLTNASSAVQYQRDVAQVARAVEAAIGAADTAVDYQSAQLEALDAQVMGLIEINQSVQTVAEAIAELEDAMIGGSILGNEPIPVTFAPGGDSGEITALRTEVATLGSKFDRLISAAEKTANESAKTNNSYLSRVVDNDAFRTRAS